MIERTIKLLSPACPGGANPRLSTDELLEEGIRPSAVIHGLRWWFRALAGGLLGTGDLSLIRRLEAGVFGGTEHCSWLRVRVPNENLLVREGLPEGASAAVSYLGYYAREKVWLAPGSWFTVRIQGEGLRLQLAETLLDLWIRYGGLGSRSRHGLGSMGPEPEEAVPREDLGVRVRQELEAGVAAMRGYLRAVSQEIPAEAPGELPSYPVVRPGCWQAAWNCDGRDWTVALQDIQTLWRGSRLRNPHDRRHSRNSLMIHGYLDPRASPGPAVEVKFAGLGLPLAFGLANRYRGEHDRARGSSGSVEPKGDVGTRRASPIWFRLRRVAEGGVAIVALRWVSTYLPDDVELVVKGRRRLQAGEPKFDPHKWEPDKELPEIGATFDRDEAEHWWAANIVGAQGWRSL